MFKGFISKYSTVFLFLSLLFFNPLASEIKEENPLHKSIPCLEPSLEALLNLKLHSDKFIPVPFRESLEANWFPTEENFFQDIAIQISERNFKDFCNGQAALSEDSLIPQIIHLIWLGSTPPVSVNLAVDSWKRHHPSWEVKLWTENEMKNFVWTSAHSETVFNQGKNWAEKSDILRLELLYQFGGIYSDTDVICFKPFDSMISKGITFFAGLESNKIKRFGRPLLGSALIGAVKGSSVIKKCMEYTQSAEQAPTIHQHLRSGPGPVTTACYEALESGDQTILVLPCSYFYPLPWEKRLASIQELIENIRPESFAIHLWEGSWFDFYHPPQSPKYTQQPTQ